MTELDKPWLTYAEAGVMLGLSPEAVRQRAARNEWPKRRDGNRTNDPVRVQIPEEELIRAAHKSVQTDEQSPEQSQGQAGQSAKQSGLDTSTQQEEEERRRFVQALQERLAVAEALRDEARAQRDEALQMRDEALRLRDEARSMVEEARVRAAGAEAELRGVREALEEARKPFWRRWLG